MLLYHKNYIISKDRRDRDGLFGYLIELISILLYFWRWPFSL